MPSAKFMDLAFEEAKAAGDRGEVPVGAVIASAAGQILAANGNRSVELHDPTAHAEMLVIRTAAGEVGDGRLQDCDIFVTLEPCAMCAAAISFARIRRVFFGAYDPKGGGVDHGARVFDHPTCHHRPDVIGGVMEAEAAELMRSFFRERRQP